MLGKIHESPVAAIIVVRPGTKYAGLAVSEQA